MLLSKIAISFFFVFVSFCFVAFHQAALALGKILYRCFRVLFFRIGRVAHHTLRFIVPSSTHDRTLIVAATYEVIVFRVPLLDFSVGEECVTRAILPKACGTSRSGEWEYHRDGNHDCWGFHRSTSLLSSYRLLCMKK